MQVICTYPFSPRMNILSFALTKASQILYIYNYTYIYIIYNLYYIYNYICILYSIYTYIIIIVLL